MLKFSFLSLLDARPTLACVHDVCELWPWALFYAFIVVPSKLLLKLALLVTILILSDSVM